MEEFIMISKTALSTTLPELLLALLHVQHVVDVLSKFSPRLVRGA
jgi:hypothetical protein